MLHNGWICVHIPVGYTIPLGIDITVTHRMQHIKLGLCTYRVHAFEWFVFVFGVYFSDTTILGKVITRKHYPMREVYTSCNSPCLY